MLKWSFGKSSLKDGKSNLSHWRVLTLVLVFLVPTSIGMVSSSTPSIADEVAAGVEAERKTVNAKDLVEINNSIKRARDLFLNDNYDEAVELYKKILSVQEIVIGENHQDFVINLNELAHFYAIQGRWRDAEPIMKRSLNISEKIYGVDNKIVDDNLFGLAICYISLTKFADAIAVLKKLTEIREAILGELHPGTIQALNLLGVSYVSQGLLSDAEKTYMRSLFVSEKVKGLWDVTVADALDGLVHVYSSQDRYIEAEPIAKRSLAIREKVRGLTHPDIVRNLNSLANVSEGLGRYVEANHLLNRSLIILESAFGTEHLEFAKGLNRLTNLKIKLDHLVEAEALVMRSLEIYEGHARTLKKKAEGAAPSSTARDALDIVSILIANDLTTLGAIYGKQNLDEKQGEVLTRSLGVLNDIYSSGHRSLAIDISVPVGISAIADLYSGKGRHADADVLLRQAIEMAENRLGAKYALIANISTSIGSSYLAQKRYNEVESYLLRALEIREGGGQLIAVPTLRILTMLMDLYQQQNRHNDALDFANRSLRILERITSFHSQNILPFVMDVAYIYRSHGYLRELNLLCEMVANIEISYTDIATQLALMKYRAPGSTFPCN
ncbi:hypothetical protein WCLP8_4830003 [uncultured Gammaproteobacteria bacterium]